MKAILRKIISENQKVQLRKMYNKSSNIIRLSSKKIGEATGWKALQKKTLRTQDFPIFQISPDKIRHCLKNPYPKAHFVFKGNWDTEGSGPIKEVRNSTYTTIHQIFVEDRDYRKTPQYEKMKKAIDLYEKREISSPAKKGGYWCMNMEDVDEYFSKLKRAYTSIERSGYKRQAEVNKENPGDIKKAADEIQVLLDREGNIILGFGGTHRTIIAQILEVKMVYITLRGVHHDFVDHLIKNTDLSLQDAIENHLVTQYGTVENPDVNLVSGVSN